MRRVLIVSPHFPPVNTPDLHRVRMSLPYFQQFGWEPEVLAVSPEYVEAIREPELEATVPADVPVWRTAAVPPYWTRRVGFSDIGLRALPHLYRAGSGLLDTGRFDLVYFSSTVFFTFTLGRLWRQRFGVPFVVDLQDPWVTTYYDNPSVPRPPKYWLVSRLHRALEKWTLSKASGIVAVSPAYVEDVRHRLPGLRHAECRTIPFGGSARDLEQAGARSVEPAFGGSSNLLHGVYAGVLGNAMKRSCEIICHALRIGVDREPDLFGRVRLHFIGTDYANRTYTMKPVAERMGVSAAIDEQPQRVSYLQVLRTLKQSDFLLVPGTDDATYSASKIYPYILSRKPILATFHELSPVVDLLRRTGAGDVVTFNAASDVAAAAAALAGRWERMLRTLPFQPEVRWEEFAPFTAPETTRRQCELFDAVVTSR